jgi:2-iminobutanoate/2-iminopropanoate deaminase
MADVPAAAGPYRVAVRHGDLLFCSGQIGLDPGTGEMVEGGAAAEMRQVMKNLAAVCEEAGTSLEKALKMTVYTTATGEFPALNEVYAGCFEGEPPARGAMGVTFLPRGALVMVDAIVAV